MELNLTTPEGPIAAKYTRFVLDGEPQGSIQGVSYVGMHQALYMAGDTGTSKTSALADWLIWSCYLYPGSQNGLFRAALQDLKRSTSMTLERRLQNLNKKLYNLNRQDWVVTFPYWVNAEGKPSTIHMFGLDTGDPIAKLKSFETFRIGIDEANEVEEHVFDLALLRIREKAYHRTLKVNGQPFLGFNQVKLVSNRDGGETHWLYVKFRRDAKEVIKDHYRKTFFIPENDGLPAAKAASLLIETYHYENHSLNSNIRATSAMMSSQGRERFLGGVWAKLEGRVFPDFGDHNVIQPEAIPQDWPVFVGIDHGTAHPTVAIFIAIDYDGNWYVFDEYVARHVTASENARTILMKWGQRRNPVYWYGDPAMWQTEASGLSPADYYIEAGIPLAPSLRTASLRAPEQRENDTGINELMERIKPRGALGGQIKPRMFWMRNCAQSIGQFRSITWEELAKIKNDDLVKATRYAVVMMPTSIMPTPSDLEAASLPIMTVG